MKTTTAAVELYTKARVLYIQIGITSTSLSDSAQYNQPINMLSCKFPSSARQLIC